MVRAKKWVIATPVKGKPTLSNFRIVEEDLPACQGGDLIVESVYLTVDPYMRYRVRGTAVGDTIISYAVAKVIESNNGDFPTGSYMIGPTNWCTHAYVSGKKIGEPMGFSALADLGQIPKSTALGVLGMPGNTAYFGFLEICRPKAGDVVLVNGAAGAVGSAVCQIAKIKGCTVIAFAGSDTKVAWLKELGIDHVFNYKTVDISDALKQVAPPTGINCYFDNVGGEFTSKALPFMADFARISICGAISTYNDEDKSIEATQMNSPYNEGKIIFKQLKIEGFLVPRWWNRWNEGIQRMREWIEKDQIKYKETVTEGFENMPKAFIGLFEGDNIGKAVVKV